MNTPAPQSILNGQVHVVEVAMVARHARSRSSIVDALAEALLGLLTTPREQAVNGLAMPGDRRLYVTTGRGQPGATARGDEDDTR